MKINDEKLQRLALISLFLFTFSGVISLLSVKVNILALRLWKEGIIISFLLICIGVTFLKDRVRIRNLIILLALFFPFMILYVLLSVNVNKLLIAYQIKVDIIPVFYVIALSLIITTKKSADIFYQKLLKLIVIVAIINSLFIYLESLFPSFFMSFLEIDDMNNSGRASGVRLDNTLWGLRAMGTMTSFINAGTLTLFGFICLLDGKVFKGAVKWICLLMLLSAMVLTTYKSTMIGFLVYAMTKVTYHVFKRIPASKFIYLFSAAIFFMIMAFSFLTYGVYDVFSPTKYKKIAYDSIYVRVQQHQDILGEMEANDGFYTGLGLGKNGNMGPDEKLKLTSKPLDSTYIYIMSNYGIIGVIIWVSLFFGLLLYLCSLGNRVDTVAVSMLLYALGVEFFINNIFTNFPCNIIFFSIIFLSVVHRANARHVSPEG